MEFVTRAAEDAVNFSGDAVALASAARQGDEDAVANLTHAFAAIAVLTGIRLRPPWLPAPDAGQEAMLVLRRLIEDGSSTIVVDLPSAIQATFMGLRPPDGGVPSCSRSSARSLRQSPPATRPATGWSSCTCRSWSTVRGGSATGASRSRTSSRWARSA